MATEPTRITEDANGPRTTFEEIEVGHDLGSIDWEVTPGDIVNQTHLDQDFDPWYALDSPFGGPIAPPQMQYRPPRWLLSRNYNIRGLFYRWEMDNVRPIEPGVKLRLTGTIAEKYVKNDREFVVYAVEARSEDGDVVFRTRRTHVLDVLSRDVPRSGTGIDSGIKQERL